MHFFRPFSPGSIRVFALVLAGLSPLLADDTDADPVRPAPAPVQDPGRQRVLGVLPNFRTVEDTGSYEPISTREKFTIATKDTVDYPLMIVGLGFAGLAQLTDQHQYFGEGVKGFAHRYGTAYADQFVSNYLTEGLMPILLHEDPRYFRRGSAGGGVWSRTAYAASRILITKTDRGRATFNFSEVLGNAAFAGIASAYYPGERRLSNNAARFSTQLGTDAISQVLKEFWPDVKRKYFSRRHRDAS